MIISLPWEAGTRELFEASFLSWLPTSLISWIAPPKRLYRDKCRSQMSLAKSTITFTQYSLTFLNASQWSLSNVIIFCRNILLTLRIELHRTAYFPRY